MMDHSEGSLFDPIEDGGSSIGYPKFSPPGAASSFLPPSLPEPLLSLPGTYLETPSLPTTLSPQHSSNFPPLIPPATSLASGGAGSREPSSSVDTVALRMQHLEALCGDLQREKNVMEDQFGQQRRKFMNLMVQKDEELSRVKRSVETLSSELQRCQQELRDRDEELQRTLISSKARDAETREAFDADRIKYEEEIASLRSTIDGEGRGEGEYLLSPGSRQRRSPSPGDPLLQGDLAKAVEESRLLKSVVLPLEKQEIDKLQTQLKEAWQRLQRAEEVKRLDSPPLIDLEGSDLTLPSDNKLQRQLELERSARHDLEMHTRALEEQKITLQEEVGLLKSQLENVSEKLRSQKESYQQLKQTWDMANQHFIVAQDILQQKMYFMEQKKSPSNSTSIFPVQERSGGPSVSHLSTRSHSCDDIRESGGGSQLQTAALESELKRVRERLEQRTATCESYEAQLTRVQEQMLEELEEKDTELVRLREECNRARAGVARERKAKEELRRKMEEACEQFKAQVESFQSGMHTQQTKLKSLRDQYTQSKHEAQRDLARFSDERVSLFAQVGSAQEEYDCLKVLQAEEKEKYAESLRVVSQERTMAEDNVAALQDRLTEVEREKEELCAQLSEQHGLRDRQRELKESQLEAARRQIAALELVKDELEQEQQMKKQALAARSDVEEKSRTFIEEQHQRLESEATARQVAELQVRDLQRQMASLRSQLNTSQENQKDFVELSQTLQMRLAKIEEEQTFHTAPNPS